MIGLSGSVVAAAAVTAAAVRSHQTASSRSKNER
jgi:hypothetical protein